MAAKKPTSTIVATDYKDCLRYIEKYWKEITCYIPKDKFKHLGLPNRFISPNHDIYKNDQFYWDSYFTILGLVKCGREQLAKGMVDNLIHLQKRFGIIPMRNRFYNLGSSQPPFLTAMIKEVYDATGNLRWRKTAMKAAEEELENYWMNKSLTEVHIVYKGLSRYCDHYITHMAAEQESGWDTTSRFHDHALDYLPIDLNCMLYRYEVDLAEFYKSIRSKKKYDQFVAQAASRQKAINKLMWNAKKGFFFDYDYKRKKQTSFYSLAGYYPMWAKLATEAQAKKMVNNLRQFEFDGGLANSQGDHLASEYRQHDYPNGWPQQQWVVVKGLMNYGYKEDAERIAKKYLDLIKAMFKKTGKIWEKYDVVDYAVSESERYATQYGFAWTNAVFIRLLDKFTKEV
jgi:alpha,alpha-trehalase